MLNVMSSCTRFTLNFPFVCNFVFQFESLMSRSQHFRRNITKRLRNNLKTSVDKWQEICGLVGVLRAPPPICVLSVVPLSVYSQAGWSGFQTLPCRAIDTHLELISSQLSTPALKANILRCGQFVIIHFLPYISI